MLTWLLIFLLLCIALLAVPVTLTYRVSWQRGFQGDARLLWLFGLVRVQLPSHEPPSAVQENKTRTLTVGRSVHSSRDSQDVLRLVGDPLLRRRIFRFIRDTWHAIHKRNVSVNVCIGLGDPADTGQLWAIVGPLAGFLSTAREAAVGIDPDFLDTTFELDSCGNIRLVPLQMVWLTAGLLLSPPVWKGIKHLRAVEG